jgi:hypothetical protein
MTSRFEFNTNPTKKTPLSPNTITIYKANLNRLAKSDLKITTERQLIDRAKEVIAWMNQQKYTQQQEKFFLSAIFYVINKPPYSDLDRKLYIERFQLSKRGQINASTDEKVITNQKEWLNKVNDTEATLKANIKSDIQVLKDELEEAEELLQIVAKQAIEAKRKLATARLQAKEKA